MRYQQRDQQSREPIRNQQRRESLIDHEKREIIKCQQKWKLRSEEIN